MVIKPLVLRKQREVSIYLPDCNIESEEHHELPTINVGAASARQIIENQALAIGYVYDHVSTSNSPDRYGGHSYLSILQAAH